jgi:NAD dependent epimerase/dehydratase family enzyme
VHRDDLVSLILLALDDARVSGPLVAASPAPCTMRDLAAALGRALRRPSWLRVPRAMLALAFGEGADVLCQSQRALPRRALALGFHFQFPDVDEALRQIVRRDQ